MFPYFSFAWSLWKLRPRELVTRINQKLKLRLKSGLAYVKANVIDRGREYTYKQGKLLI